jgi:hypothetical protein
MLAEENRLAWRRGGKPHGKDLSARLFNPSDGFMPMDDTVILVAGACVALAFLVWLMWRAATKAEWGQLTVSEKRRWRIDEEKRKEKAAK